MKVSLKIVAICVCLTMACTIQDLQAQQFTINSAGGCFEPEEGIVKTNFWMFGEFATGVSTDGEITSYNGFIPFAIVEDFVALEIEEQQVILQLNVYPVPTSGIAELYLNSKESQSARLEIYDLNGQLLESETAELVGGENRLQIDLTDYPSGNYLVRLANDNGTLAISKVVKR